MTDPEKHVDIDSAPFITDYNNFRERTESGTLTRDRLVSEGIGARILAGGNMVLRITGALLNDASVITANGNLTQDGGGSVDNRGYRLTSGVRRLSLTIMIRTRITGTPRSTGTKPRRWRPLMA